MTWFVPIPVADTVGHLDAQIVDHLMHVRDVAVPTFTMTIGKSVRGDNVSFICATCRETFDAPQGPNGTHLTTEDELGTNYFCCEPCKTHWETLPG